MTKFALEKSWTSLIFLGLSLRVFSTKLKIHLSSFQISEHVFILCRSVLSYIFRDFIFTNTDEFISY